MRLNDMHSADHKALNMMNRSFLFKEPEKPRVLIIEDDRSTRRIIRHTFKKDYNLLIAGNGSLGFHSFKNFMPDITFLDIELPDTDGHTLMQKMEKYNPNAFVVIVSGHSDNDNVYRSIENGAKGFIAKPFSEKKMRFFVQQSLNSNHMK